MAEASTAISDLKKDHTSLKEEMDKNQAAAEKDLEGVKKALEAKMSSEQVDSKIQASQERLKVDN